MSPGDSGASKMSAFSATRDAVELFGSTLQPRWTPYLSSTCAGVHPALPATFATSACSSSFPPRR